MSDLKTKYCESCEGFEKPFNASQIAQLMPQLDSHWRLENNYLIRKFQFKNFYETMAFVNAVSWLAHQENHHPDLAVQYQSCEVKYLTHAVDGLTMNDFICAAKVDDLL